MCSGYGTSPLRFAKVQARHNVSRCVVLMKAKVITSVNYLQFLI